MAITLKNIYKSFNSTIAVKDFSYNFKKSKITVLIGPSGCGKSSLLRLIVGLIKPDSGAIEINDRLLTDLNIQSFRKRIGYVIQDRGLFPHLTAKQNISLMAAYTGLSDYNILSKIEQLSHLTKFPSDGLQRFPAELSGGQKQRVSLMRALMLDAEFLLLDEPLGALDPLIRYDLQKDLKEIFGELKKTVVMVTHDLYEAVFFADEIVLIKDGSIIQSGTIDDLIQSPADPFVTRFVNAQRSEIITSRDN
ncbi:MAG: ATP-binding cassette domain-containing protein [Ignavibacterium sp.]|nr:MAG: ATP-binding cassette domain-containing protein [Ignavibacterium sp.]